MNWLTKLLGKQNTTSGTVKLGNQVWMTKNFVGGHRSGGEYDPAWKPSIYGDQYSFSQAISNAPQGWHLPTEEEWYELGSTISELKDTKKILLEQFKLVFFKGHAYFWTSTIIHQGSNTRCFMAEMTRYQFDRGVYRFEIKDKSDLFVYPARYVKD